MQGSRKPPNSTSPDVMTPKTNRKASCYNAEALTGARTGFEVIHHQGFCIHNFYTDVPFFSPWHIYLSENMIYHSFVPTEVGQQSTIRFYGLFSCLFLN